MIKVEKVLIPVDGSDSSRNAAKYGTMLVNARNPKIYLLNVWEPVNMTIGGEMAEKLRQSAQAKSMAMLEEYKKMIPEFGFRVIDATQPIQKQQKEIRQVINGVLRGWEGLPNPIQSSQKYSRLKKAEEQKGVSNA